MFDTYYRQEASYPSSVNVSVTEKRAPTDESVRLLHEMQVKAESELLKAVRLDRNDFKGMVHIYRDALNLGKKVIVLFELNGKQVRHESLIREWTKQEDIADILIKELAETIAREVILSTFTNEQFSEWFARK